MTTVKVTSNITFEELINGVLQLSATDYDKFIKKVQELKKQKAQFTTKEKELNLIEQIKEELPLQQKERLQQLEANQNKRKLTKKENKEMEIIIQNIERLHAQRILAIGLLAQLKNTSVEQISKQLGFNPIFNG